MRAPSVGPGSGSGLGGAGNPASRLDLSARTSGTAERCPDRLSAVHDILYGGFELHLRIVCISARFRAFFAFDNASVNLQGGSGTNLLNDPGFESATVGTSFRRVGDNGVSRLRRPIAGVVAGPGGTSACSPNGAFAGNNFWCDGAVQGYDGVWQKIATTPGATYDVSFYLGDNSGDDPYNPGIDMFVYAGDSLPKEPKVFPSRLRCS